MIAGVSHLLKSRERERMRATGMEKAAKKGQGQKFFHKKLQRRPGQPVDVFEKAVLDMKAEGLNVELKNMGWHLFEKRGLTLERQERVLGAA